MGFYENRVWQRRSSIATSIVQAETKKDNPPKYQPPTKEKKQSITNEMIFEKEETKIVNRNINLIFIFLRIYLKNLIFQSHLRFRA